ncbi:MAG: beta-ketoacyl-[acyl-carrier-protein] synthase family protein [Candidatus Delongbacteria bacterium]|jgi:3-oxoacyl-(acyl-carrier-protein) synthase|nr:beta-ketoacyl-[acyl-carrier-protein] synthase family protein [Candidatus Delongbacteria bacterium]
MNKRVVITGMGVVSPNATGLKNFENAIRHGKTGIQYIPELKKHGFSCQVGGIPDITNAEHLPVLNKYSLDQADMAIRYAVLAGIEAWTNAGMDIPDFNGSEMYNEYGAIIGTCFGGTEIMIRKIHPLVKAGKTRRLGSQIVEHWMPSGSAAALSSILALANQTTANSSACSTGNEAIVMAYNRVKAGKAKCMHAGGTDPYSPYAWAGFDSMRVLTRKHNETPEQASRPMSESAGGFVPAAGAGVVLVEELDHALKRDARIYAEIIGGSINSGGHRHGGTMTAPNPTRVIDCIRNAINEAGISGDDIDLVSGHLTGTLADKIEIQNWVDALKLTNKFPYFNSLKSMIGHTIGAAGAIEFIASVLQIYNQYIHPSINCEDVHPDIKKMIPSDKIPHEIIAHAKIQYLAKAAFGFGDVNSCVLLTSMKN